MIPVCLTIVQQVFVGRQHNICGAAMVYGTPLNSLITVRAARQFNPTHPHPKFLNCRYVAIEYSCQW